MSFLSSSRRYQKGTVFFALLAAIGMVSALGAVTMSMLKGPIQAMAQVTKRTVAENAMIANGKLSLVMSASMPGDCDGDGRIEPLEWTDAGTGPAPANGGYLPATIGASLQDPWGNSYGYCAWDHGSLTHHAGCGAGARRLQGGPLPSHPVVAIISSGPDRIFQTGCLSHGQSSYVLKAPDSDDLVLTYSYAEASSFAGGLWNLKEDDVNTATIAKNLSVTDEGGTEQLSFDADAKALSLAAGGTGELPNIKTDYIQNLSANAPVEFLAAIKAGPATIISEESNAIAAIVTASGSAGVGLKASGTAKAIEAAGILDMTHNKIVNLLTPADDTDAATKKYVDDKTKSIKRVKCEAFVFSGCSGGTTSNLDKSSLGDCKKACEAAGVTCCSAQYATVASNPHAALGQCVGHDGGKPSGSLVNLVTGLLFPAYVGAYCYEQY